MFLYISFFFLLFLFCNRAVNRCFLCCFLFLIIGQDVRRRPLSEERFLFAFALFAASQLNRNSALRSFNERFEGQR